MTDLPAIRQTMLTAWSTARQHAARAALWSTRHPFASLGLLYGLLTYFTAAVLIGVPGRAIVALMIVGPAAWECLRRYTAWVEPRTPKISFFTWDNGPLRLSEGIGASGIVYCVGVKNEGRKITGGVRVSIDSIAGHALSTSGASLPIFRSPDDSVSLQPGESEYFCVMRRMDEASAAGGSVAICCHDNLIAPTFGIQDLVAGRAMTLSAHGEGAPRTTRQFQISASRAADAAWSLHMSFLPGGDEPPALVPEQPSVAAGPRRLTEARALATAGLGRLRDSIGERCKKAFARAASDRPERLPEPIRHPVTLVQPIAADAQPAKSASLDQDVRSSGTAKESPAQSDRVRRLLAGQARA